MAVALTLKQLIKEAKDQQLAYTIADRCPGPENGTLFSAVIVVQGKGADYFAESWDGQLLWIAQSPYRRFHKRKNWFIGIEVYDETELMIWNEQDIRYQTLRSSGPGGQNVNKVETAVRATHIPSGLNVMVNESRSQLQNKKIATERLKAQFSKWQLTPLQQNMQEQWQNHNSLERGNPTRTYAGMDFKKIK
jgi:peptide chain release factor